MFQRNTKKPVIIWDGGGVVVEFNPLEMAKKFDFGKYESQVIGLFASQDWKDYDNGDFNEDELYRRMIRHSIPAGRARALFQFFLESLKPKWETIFLIEQLYQLGYEQFYLSNGARTYLNYINSQAYLKKEGFNLKELFKEQQILLSADVRISKPKQEIFAKAEEVFKLKGRSANTIIFVDDSLANIEAVKQRTGWCGLHFQGAANLKIKLEKMGIYTPQPDDKLVQTEQPTLHSSRLLSLL